MMKTWMVYTLAGVTFLCSLGVMLFLLGWVTWEEVTTQ